MTGDVDLASVCPNGVARITDEHTFLNWLVSAFLGGFIDTPTSVEIGCSAGPAMQPQAMTIELPMTPETIERIRATYPNARCATCGDDRRVFPDAIDGFAFVRRSVVLTLRPT